MESVTQAWRAISDPIWEKTKDAFHNRRSLNLVSLLFMSSHLEEVTVFDHCGLLFNGRGCYFIAPGAQHGAYAVPFIILLYVKMIIPSYAHSNTFKGAFYYHIEVIGFQRLLLSLCWTHVETLWEKVFTSVLSIEFSFRFCKTTFPRGLRHVKAEYAIQNIDLLFVNLCRHVKELFGTYIIRYVVFRPYLG